MDANQKTQLLQDLPRLVEEAISNIRHQRFYESERAFQGQFLSELNQLLGKFLEAKEFILEQEHQKNLDTHGLRQRPDLILHAPRSTTGDPTAGNLAFWFFKLNANIESAKKDFKKMDSLASNLKYSMGFFINIQADQSHAGLYAGDNPKLFIFRACKLDAGKVKIYGG